MTRNLAVLDTETSVKSKIGSKSSPFWPDNKIVVAASKVDGNDTTVKAHPGKNCDGRELYIVGQNVKFDLQHLRKAGTWTTYKDLKIWDTQTAEYLLTNQQHQFASLDELAKKYGGTLKDSRIKEYWESGMDTEDIPRKELEEYLIADVDNTDLVAAAQMRLVAETGRAPLVMTQMDALLAVTDMEYNGFCISERKLEEYGHHLGIEIGSYGLSLLDAVPTSIRPHFNLDSTQHISALLFGGGFEWDVVSDGAPYKNGKPRKHKITHHAMLPGFVTDATKSLKRADWLTPKGKWSTSEEVLQDIETNCAFSDKEASQFCGMLLTYRGLKKEYCTYVEGLKKLIYPDGMLHGSIHTCSTDTGRYSSSKPNLQNMPASSDSKIRHCFVSRWGDKGKIVTADFKQLEVVALAYLSRDPQLMADIKDGRDIHYETGLIAGMWGHKAGMTPDKRRTVKTINFGLIYGGGAVTLAKKAKCSVDTAQRCIDAFYKRYPGVRTWHKQLLEEVERNAVSLGHVTKSGIPVKTSYLKICTGRTFELDQTHAPWDKMGMRVSWPVNKIKNYPVQGLATGDIVPLLLSKVWTRFQNHGILRERALFVNVVHDEIVLDVKESVVDEVVRLLTEELTNGPAHFEETFGVEFDLPLSVDIHVGDSWGACKT